MFEVSLFTEAVVCGRVKQMWAQCRNQCTEIYYEWRKITKKEYVIPFK